MTTLRPFFLLAGRASAFWVCLIQVFVASVLLLGLGQPDSRIAPHVDAVFLAAFAFPAVIGGIAGTVVQELQSTTFAMLLPGVRARVAPGYLIAGLAVVGVVVALIGTTASSPPNLPVLFAVGLGGYCLGGVFVDPLSRWITSLNVVLALLLAANSRDVARVAGHHPWLATAVALGIGAACFYRLFARSTFRRKPFGPASRLPGRFSFERSQEDAIKRLVRSRPNGKSWQPAYLGNGAWRWVRAALHEVHGARGLGGTTRSVGRAWPLLLIVVGHAWIEKGDMGLGQAIARSIHDALFRSPHVPQFGERGLHALVALTIATLGALTALLAPVALSGTVTYPLSRMQLSRVHFRCGLVDVAVLLFVLGGCLFVIGSVAGRLVGYEARLDFMPFFFRVLLVTLILVPLAHWGRLRLLAAIRRRVANTQLWVTFGIIGFVLAVVIGTLVSASVFGSPVAELVGLAALLVISQLVYRQALTRHYRAADLV